MFRVGFQGWIVALTIFCSIVFADSARAQGSNAALAQELSNPIANLISVPFVTNYGIVTLWNRRRVNSVQRLCSSGGRCDLPYAHRFVAKLAECLSGNQMALRVEGVVDGGMG